VVWISVVGGARVAWGVGGYVCARVYVNVHVRVHVRVHVHVRVGVKQ
jgi:hypothetical protein